MPLDLPSVLPPLGPQTEPDKVRVAAVVGGMLGAAPARGFGLTTEELTVVEDLAAGTVDGYQIATAETRSRIVNGAMQVSQENGVTPVGNTLYPVDEWRLFFVSTSTVTAAQVVGTTGSPQPRAIGIGASPAEASAAAGEYVQLLAKVEGNKVSDFGLGTASSKQFVIAFDVNVPVAGTYWVAVSTDGSSHSYLGSYTIAAGEVATWVRRSIVVPAGAINAGTWPITTAASMAIHFTFHCGSTYTGIAGFQAGNFLAGPGQALGLSTATSCYLTNVGLYLDPLATGIAPPWVMPDEAEELRACQRYYQNNYYLRFSGNVTSAATYYTSGLLPVPTRVNPAITGVHSGTTGFPAAVGTISVYSPNSFTEGRAASATLGGSFTTIYTANARM